MRSRSKMLWIIDITMLQDGMKLLTRMPWIFHRKNNRHKPLTRCPSFDLDISTAIGPERGRLQMCDLKRS